MGAAAGNLVEILRCPNTGRPLRWASDHELAAEEGPIHPVMDGLACLLPKAESSAPATNGADQSISEFYNDDGWTQDEQGLFKDTKAFLDVRTSSMDYTRKCIARLSKYFRQGGTYILDAGSGAVPHDELLAYSKRYQHRVCVDLAMPALRAARTKVGPTGVYLQGDLTNLPLQDDSMDAVTCNHVIYQIPAERQAAAFLELYRVLKPGGVAVIVYLWPKAPLAGAIGKLVRMFGGKTSLTSAYPPSMEEEPQLYHHPHPLEWFTSQKWPFRYSIDCFRLVSNGFMQGHVKDDRPGRLLLSLLFQLQRLAPALCGRYGAVPAIVIRKD
jgi:ubiquinone/menaquinone biosynthesis C-methylase UbiE